MKKKLVSLALALAVCLGLAAPVFADESDFTIKDGVLIRYHSYSYDVDVIIPDGVTSIGDSAFEDAAMASVTIPDSVTSIGEGAFKYCTRLTNVTIPNGVTSISKDTFSGCDKLTSVTIPSSVTSIGMGAFYYCKKLTSVTIPDGVTSIGQNAFYGCKALADVTIPDSVTSIGDYAFATTPWLKGQGEFAVVNGILLAYQGQGGDVTIPDGISSIGGGAFLGIDLTGVTIPDSVTDIGTSAFQWRTGLTSVTIPGSVTSIGDYAFSDCTSLTDVTIPDSVTSIGYCAFAHCTSLTSVILPDGVASIDSRAFIDCTGLTDVYYGGSEAQWKAIKIDGYNEDLTGAAIHYSGSAVADPAPTTPTTPTPPVPAVSSFTDVKEDDYFAQPVAWAVEKKVTNGTSATEFSPNQTCTVAQILTFLSRAKGSPEPAGTASLPGVDSGAYYYKPAAWALEQGLTDTFSADAPCTRSMVVTYLWKLAGSPAAGTSKFSDVPSNASYAQAVTWAVEQGITNGTSATTFSPDATCTRGQIVTFLHRAFVK